MSSFDGIDLFGSGAHHIVVGGEAVAHKDTAFVGVDGIDSMVMGGRGYPVRIWGILKAGSRAAVDDLIADIEEAVRDWGPSDLIDADGNIYTFVKLYGISLQGRYMINSESDVFIQYSVAGRKLY